MFIALLGCDGSGKSSVIAGIFKRLRDQHHSVYREHWMPRAFSSIGSNGISHSCAEDPHGQLPRGLALSIVKLFWIWLNWWVGWWKLLRNRAQTGFVIFDRYHVDLLIDPRRYRYGGPHWLAKLASNAMPQPDIVIFLDADPYILLSRKQEISHDALMESRMKYLAICKEDHRFQTVDAGQSIDTVINEVMLLIEHAN